MRTSKRPSLSKHVGDQFDQFDVVVDEQHLPLAALQGIGRDAVVLHEREQLIARNAAEAAAGNAEAFQLAGVETANDRLLADLADLGGFARREYGLHALCTTLLPSRNAASSKRDLEMSDVCRTALSKVPNPPCYARRNLARCTRRP